MQLDGPVAQVQEQLAAAAALGDDRTRDIAAALAIAAGPAVRLALVGTLSAAAEEPAVAVRFDGDDAELTVRATAAEPVPPVDDAGDATARISLRLSPALKVQIDAAADGDGVSVNTWLVRAAAAAVAVAGAARSNGPRRRNEQHITGWVNG